jgi:hypothetical protein
MPRADVNAHALSPGIDVAWIAMAPVADGSMPGSVAGTAPVLCGPPTDFAALAASYRRFRSAGAPAVIRLNCSDVPLEPWAWSPIPEFAEREEACLLLDFGQRPAADRWAALVRFAREYPRLPLLALGMPLNAPVTGKALDASPNIVLEAYDEPQLAALCGRYGAYRFAYGSAGRAPVTPLLQGVDLEQVASATASELGEGRWGAKYL